MKPMERIVMPIFIRNPLALVAKILVGGMLGYIYARVANRFIYKF